MAVMRKEFLLSNIIILLAAVVIIIIRQFVWCVRDKITQCLHAISVMPAASA
jgi:hypothetical protein